MFNRDLVERGIKTVLEGLDLGEKEEFVKTPQRMARALFELCRGLEADIEEEVFKDGIFPVGIPYHRVPTKFANISARGICPHHLLPVIYKVDVSYKPQKKVAGLSRVHRLVRILAARPVLQEQLTFDIAKALHDKLDCPVYVRLEGLHMCMISRGSETELDAPVITEMEFE